MSNNKDTQSTDNTEQKPEKVVTKYDLKMQRRKEQKEKELRDRRIGRIIGVVLAVALVCFVASFPIRNLLTVKGTYVTVNGEQINRVEFDYYYQTARNEYMSTNGMYLSYFGLDLSGDLSRQMYSETLTWKDYFEEVAVQNIARNKGMLKEARAEGFTYDTGEDYREYEEMLEQAASENGYTVKDYVKELYGVYATPSRIKPYIEEALYVAAYYDKVAEGVAPAMEEIESYYAENKASYDSVDYYMETVDAQLPTEPTELADPVEEPEEGEEENGGDDGESGEEQTYQPSEAEIAAAMEKAKEEADKAVKTIRKGELHEGARRTAINSNVRDWLYDEARKEGDTNVIEDAANHRYYVVCFMDRYLEETPSADLHIAMTDKGNGQALMDEWKGGEATEETFAELCDKYNDASVMSARGGLVEGALPSSVPDELKEWMTDEARQKGDTVVISPETEEYDYVVYYAGPNDAEWAMSIRNTLINEKMSEYLEEKTQDIQVQDSRGNLNYLKVRAQEEAAKASAESSEGTEEGNTDFQEPGTEGSGESGTEEDGSSEEPGTEDSGSAQ